MHSSEGGEDGSPSRPLSMDVSCLILLINFSPEVVHPDRIFLYSFSGSYWLPLRGMSGTYRNRSLNRKNVPPSSISLGLIGVGALLGTL